MSTANAAVPARTWAPTAAMPWLVAVMAPLATIEPLIVVSTTLMPVAAVILPVLVMPPLPKVPKNSAAVTAIPLPLVEMRPLLPTLPEKVPPKIFIAMSPAEIVPALVMPSETLVSPAAKIPTAPAEIIPALLIPPSKLVTCPTSMPKPECELAEITPPLLFAIPPTRVAMFSISMPVRFASILPALATPPPELLLPKAVTLPTAMPTAFVDEIVPPLPLLIPPAKFETFAT